MRDLSCIVDDIDDLAATLTDPRTGPNVVVDIGRRIHRLVEELKNLVGSMT